MVKAVDGSWQQEEVETVGAKAGLCYNQLKDPMISEVLTLATGPEVDGTAAGLWQELCSTQVVVVGLPWDLHRRAL